MNKHIASATLQCKSIILTHGQKCTLRFKKTLIIIIERLCGRLVESLLTLFSSTTVLYINI